MASLAPLATPMRAVNIADVEQNPKALQKNCYDGNDQIGITTWQTLPCWTV